MDETTDGNGEPVPDTYEMLWDCPSCGAKKLLGVSHRFCPSCGTVQDAAWRYFPSDEDKVPVAAHRYSGKDRVCSYCGATQSAAAHNCSQCGAPLEAAKEAVTASSRFQGEGVAFSEAGLKPKDEAKASRVVAPAPARRRGGPILILGLVSVILAVIILAIFWERDVSVTVSDRSWKRAIEVQQYSSVSDGSWCDALPGGAYSVQRERRQRGEKSIRDGETCRKVQVDKGDGSFREVRRCEPKYRYEPVYDYYCSFRVNRWVPARQVERSGGNLDEPLWPEVTLSSQGQCLGCERLGPRTAHYTLGLSDERHQSVSCDVPEELWKRVPIGAPLIIARGRLFGEARCSTVRLPQG